MGEMPRFALTLILAIWPPTAARAQHMNEKDSPCAKVVATVELADCLAKAREVADSELNATYKRVHERLGALDDQRLAATQRLWIQYRDANCSAERDLYAGGTASSPVYLACIEAMTRARTKELTITYTVKLK
jgi:uncharacterized protein YecT (DUF1311 family)